MSPLISRQITGFNRRGYKPIIPLDSLYSHWDFSRLTDNVGTEYTNDNTGIPNTSGLSIGASSTTPQMFHRRANNSGTTTVGIRNGRKCLSISLSTGVQNQGAYLQSLGNAFPNVTSSSYTWIAAWRHSTSISFWTRIYRWYLNAYSYDFNHGTWWINSGSSEVNAIHYGSVNRLFGVSFDSERAATTDSSTPMMHYDIVTVTGSSATHARNTFAGNPNRTIIETGTFNASPSYATVADSLRVFQVRPVNYQFGNFTYPALDACEYAFYTRAFTDQERISTIAALKAKWG